MTSELFAGERVEGVDVTGQVVDIWVRPNHHEIERRRSHSVGAMCDHDHIRALMDLPEGLHVPLNCLDGATLLAMDDLVDRGAVEFDGDSVSRVAVQPVAMVGISKVAECWDDARRITWLGSHAPRYVIASGRIAKRVLKEIDPQVGLAVQHDGECRIARTAGARRVFPSWQRWVIAERTFEKWLETTQPSHVSQASSIGGREAGMIPSVSKRA
ncbi:hypothetical protein [Candidatus Poriferisodalis sp.]|uniref:hypothetical protein n=1 Tax=Candidatus Poriferisodalis sp. TaxID=3101277 RepID=UPI003C6EA8F6